MVKERVAGTLGGWIMDYIWYPAAVNGSDVNNVNVNNW